MRLSIDPAPSWIALETGDAPRYRIGAVTIEVSPILPLPDHVDSWAQEVVRGELPPQSVLEIVLATDLTTADGWPLAVVESHALAADSKQIVEARLHLFYTLLFYGVLVAVKSPSADELASQRQDILDRFGRARPDWSGPIVALAQILPPEEPKPP